MNHILAPLAVAIALTLGAASPQGEVDPEPQCVWLRSYRSAGAACYEYCAEPNQSCCKHWHDSLAWYECSTAGEQKKTGTTNKYFSGSNFGCSSQCPLTSAACSHYVQECTTANC